MHATYLTDIGRTYRNYRALAERAVAQISDEQLHASVDSAVGETDNTIAVIMQHVAGNLRSRFSGFLTEDGEKPDRNRDGEFEAHSLSRDALMADWEKAW